MADIVRVITQLAFIPNGTSLGAATVRQSLTTQYTLVNKGTLQSQTYAIAAGTPKVIALDVPMALFIIDDAVNPQPVTFSGSFFNPISSITVALSQQVTATNPYLGLWSPSTSTTITNNGTGTTLVRIFTWGN
jgi:hypothetical protein